MRFPPVPAEPLLGIPILWGSLPAPGLQASSLSKSFQGDASGTISLCDSCKCYKRPAHVIQTEKNWSMSSVGPCVGKLPQRTLLLCCFQCMLIKELEGKPAILPWECLLQQRDAFSCHFEPGVTSFQPSTESIFVSQYILISFHSPACAGYFEQRFLFKWENLIFSLLQIKMCISSNIQSNHRVHHLTLRRCPASYFCETDNLSIWGLKMCIILHLWFGRSGKFQIGLIFEKRDITGG